LLGRAYANRSLLKINNSGIEPASCVGRSVLAMITSAKNSNWLYDVAITDLDSAGLSSEPIVRMKLFTLDNRLIIRQAGILADIDLQAVEAAFLQLFETSNLQVT
jgi:mRNA interferase MazF